MLEIPRVVENKYQPCLRFGNLEREQHELLTCVVTLSALETAWSTLAFNLFERGAQNREPMNDFPESKER